MDGSGQALQNANLDRAVADLRTFLRDRPESAEALVLLAQAHFAKGEAALAKLNLEKAVTADPGE